MGNIQGLEGERVHHVDPVCDDSLYSLNTESCVSSEIQNTDVDDLSKPSLAALRQSISPVLSRKLKSLSADDVEIDEIDELKISLAHENSNFQSIIKAQQEEMEFLQNERGTLFEAVNRNKLIEDELIGVKLEKENFQAKVESLREKMSKNQEVLSSLEEEKSRLQNELQLHQKELHQTELSQLLCDLIDEQTLKSWDRAKILQIEETLQDSISLVMNTRRQTERETLCCVCLEGEKTVLILPCKHLCLCKPCSRNKRIRTCPVCRTKIGRRMSVNV